MVEKVKLTAERVLAFALPAEGERIIGDAEVPGLLVRLRAGGSRTYVVRFRPGGGRGAQQRRVSVGDVAAVPLAEARRIARALVGAVAGGADPVATRRAATRREEARLSRVLDAYERDCLARGVTRPAERPATLRRELLPRLGRDADLGGITRAQFVAAFEAVAASGRPGLAKELRTRVSVLLNFAVGRGLIAANVLAGHRAPRTTRAEALVQHGRALALPEAAAVWRAAGAGRDPIFAAFVRGLMLTGCRRGEWSQARRAWIEHVDGKPFMILPAAVTKSGRPHPVPLPPDLFATLDSLPRFAADPDLIFPSRITGRPMQGWSKLLPRVVKAAGVGAFSLHDLRRTFRSGLTTLGVPADLAEMMVAHRPRDVLLSIYDRAERLPERFEAATRWADALAAAVAEAERRAKGGMIPAYEA